MTRSKWVPVVAIGALVALGTGAWWLQRGGPSGEARPVAAASAARPAGQGGGGGAGGGGAGAGGGPVVVESTLVRAQPVAEDVNAVGSLRSRQGTLVRSEVGGRVVQINFRDGQRVRRGQLLVQLDDKLQQAQVQQAQAELGIAQTNHRRNVDLSGRGFISPRGVDESAAAEKVARAKLDLARATAARMRVLAPFDGVAGLRNISVGDYLKEGDNIVNLEDMSAMFVDFRLPERLQSRVRPGQTARVQVDALPDRAFAAQVQAVDPQIDANGRALNVRGCIDNRALQLRPGMFARVETELGAPREALMVPEEAIVSQGGSLSVLRLTRADAGDKPVFTTQRVAVTTGHRLPGQVEIVTGLAVGDRVITAGHQRVQRDGQTVRLAGAGVPDGGARAPASGASAASAAAASAAPSAPAVPQAQGGAGARPMAALPLVKPPAGPSPCGLPGGAPQRRS